LARTPPIFLTFKKKADNVDALRFASSFPSALLIHKFADEKFSLGICSFD
jgi:hypothetical protein